MPSPTLTFNRINPLVIAISAFAALTLMPTTAMAAEENVLYGKMTFDGRASTYQVAVVPFGGSDALTKMVIDDLQLTPLAIKTSGLIGQPHVSSELSNSLPAWQQLDTQYVVVGNSFSSRGNVGVNFEVVEIATGKVVAAEQIIDTNAELVAHQTAGRIYEIVANKPSGFADFDARLAYIREEGIGKNKISSLVISDANGKNSKVIARINGSIFSPDISPDGQYIAYSVQLENNHPKLFMQNLKRNTNHLIKVTDLKGSQLSPSFSPDGRTILFSGTADGDADIYQVSVQGGAATKLVDQPYDQVDPSYDPSDASGNSFYFASDHASPNRPSIYRAANGAIKRVSRRSYSVNPSVSADGSKIAFLNGNQAAVMNNRGNLLVNYGRTGIDEAPTFSPNGERVVYSQGAGNSTVVIRSVTGRGKPLRFRLNGTVKSPVWIPNN